MDIFLRSVVHNTTRSVNHVLNERRAMKSNEGRSPTWDTGSGLDSLCIFHVWRKREALAMSIIEQPNLNLTKGKKYTSTENQDEEQAIHWKQSCN